jgi:cathepsin B
MRVLTKPDEIKAELMINGPMMVGFTIYEDLPSYSGGYYKPTTTNVIGGHAVKLIGWDHDPNNNLVWLCQNSWGTSWGISGFFKIYANTAGLDSAAFACIPDV